jgi:hypothetical protein
MAARGRVLAAGWAFVAATWGAPAIASIAVEPDSVPLAGAFAFGPGLSDDAAFAARWVVDNEDNRSQPFAIVDKKRAQMYLFEPTGRFVAGSAVLLGLSLGDEAVEGIESREPASLAPAERTTPAGRFASQPGHNARGEDIVWFDYGAALAIHRLRPSPASERRDKRIVSPRSDDKRISYGCVVVPVAFYDTAVRPLLGAQRGVVYVLPETRPVAEMLGRYGTSLQVP